MLRAFSGPDRVIQNKRGINLSSVNNSPTEDPVIWSFGECVVVNSLRRRQNGRYFPDEIFTCIFLKENVSISIKISLKFVSKCSINNIPALVQIMAWRRPGDKPFSEPVMVNLLTHISVTRPQWVKQAFKQKNRVAGGGSYAATLMIITKWQWRWLSRTP